MTLAIIDIDLRRYLEEVQLKVHTMVYTLLNIAHILETNTEPLVPYDYNKPWGGQHLQTSFMQVPISDYNGWIALEVGYSSRDKDGYDYAEYVHTGIDYRTGGVISWHKSTATREFLIKGIIRTEAEAMTLIEGDYLSLFRRGNG